MKSRKISGPISSVFLYPHFFKISIRWAYFSLPYCAFARRIDPLRLLSIADDL
jgi:hypothetical protein